MTTTIKTMFVLIGITFVIACFGLNYPKIKSSFVVGSPQGATFNTGTAYSVVTNTATAGANATSSSVLNSTGSDLYVTGINVGCEAVGTSKTAYTGTGLASLQLSVGTSSTAAPAVIPGNLVGGAALVIGTSTVQFVQASTTAGALLGSGLFSNIWLAGSYMTFWLNATNTAICTFGVNVINA